MREVARKLGRGETDKTLTSVWKQLREDGEVDRIGGVGSAVQRIPPLRDYRTALHPERTSARRAARP